MKKLLSISLSIIILFGNMGFTLATHYCGGHAVESSFAIGEASIGCGMDNEEESCENPTVKSKNCCENQYISMNIEDDFNTQAKQLNISPEFLFTFVYTCFNPQPSTEVTTAVFRDNSPPLLNQSRQILFQNFLI